MTWSRRGFWLAISPKQAQSWRDYSVSRCGVWRATLPRSAKARFCSRARERTPCRGLGSPTRTLSLAHRGAHLWKETSMTAVALSPEAGGAWSGADRAPLLRWLIFTGATVFAAILLWRYGLLRLMVVSDRTYLSSVIVLIYVGASLHCLWRTIVISREGDAGQQVTASIERGGADVAALDPPAALPDGLIADHIRDLAL